MKLQDLLHTKYPIIQGGMANIATGEFAAAVSNAGALGLIASGGMDHVKLKEEIDKCRALTDKPFGVNLMLMNPDADAIAELLYEEKIPVITTGAGNPGKYMAKWKENGSMVIPVCASVLLAKKMVEAGADAIIAEGGESGGHVGDMTTMTLLPQMVDALDVPVIAAGGIADGRQMAAAYVLGACGVQIGTCLLVSEECPIHENYKNALIKAKDNGTTVTGRSQGAPVRILKNRMARQYLKLEKEGADKMELEKITLGGLRKAVLDGDVDMGSVMAGQVCGQLTEIRPIADILENMYTDAQKKLEEMGRRTI
ncbi:MAG: nitronate monooxygenase [Agathobacter sp.]|nr:nitronate monooxygenase [Agathobacter sp.]MDY3795526.1 nitronate monooxygenase [Agathobacter sp.]